MTNKMSDITKLSITICLVFLSSTAFGRYRNEKQHNPELGSLKDELETFFNQLGRIDPPNCVEQVTVSQNQENHTMALTYYGDMVHTSNPHWSDIQINFGHFQRFLNTFSQSLLPQYTLDDRNLSDPIVSITNQSYTSSFWSSQGYPLLRSFDAQPDNADLYKMKYGEGAVVTPFHLSKILMEYDTLLIGPYLPGNATLAYVTDSRNKSLQFGYLKEEKNRLKYLNCGEATNVSSEIVQALAKAEHALLILAPSQEKSPMFVHTSEDIVRFYESSNVQQLLFVVKANSTQVYGLHLTANDVDHQWPEKILDKMTESCEMASEFGWLGGKQTLSLLNEFDNRAWLGCPIDLCQTFTIDDMFSAAFPPGMLEEESSNFTGLVIPDINDDARYMTVYDLLIRARDPFAWTNSGKNESELDQDQQPNTNETQFGQDEESISCSQGILSVINPFIFILSGSYYYGISDKELKDNGDSKQIVMPKLDQARLLWKPSNKFDCRPWEMMNEGREPMTYVDSAVSLIDVDTLCQVVLFFRQDHVHSLHFCATHKKQVTYTTESMSLNHFFEDDVALQNVEWAVGLSHQKRLYLGSEFKVYGFDWEPKQNKFIQVNLNEWKLSNIPFLVQGVMSFMPDTIHMFTRSAVVVYKVNQQDRNKAWNLVNVESLLKVFSNCTNENLMESKSFHNVTVSGARPLIENPTERREKEQTPSSIWMSNILWIIGFIFLIACVGLALGMIVVTRKQRNQIENLESSADTFSN